MKKEAGLVLLAALAGCDPYAAIDSDLNGRRGQPIRSVVSQLGFPQQEGKVMGRKFYVWGAEQDITLPDYGGMDGSGTLDGKAFTYSGTTYGSTSKHMSCMLRVFVDDKDRIETWNTQGHLSACGVIAERLTNR